ncbi:hypothetical protein [Nocardia pseudovaccinii]|uniref:hypothetical protein n=1 Tax=Nocardia pseudovaccinii TaxID=189540 RepID=UPI0007A4AA66|nr:hypothetical protein [Nocardia pseudovaccinii]
MTSPQPLAGDSAAGLEDQHFQRSEGASIDRPADFVVLQPDGAAIYGSRERDQGLRGAIGAHVPDLDTQGMGRVRAWFAEDFARRALHPNPLADQVLARLGYDHPSGWYGPVAVTMEEDATGHIPPLVSDVRETVNEILAAVTENSWLREVGDLAAANSVWSSANIQADDSVLRKAEERAHRAGISWKDIDGVRTVGFLDQQWTDIRNSRNIGESIRASLLEIADADAWMLRYMVAVDVIRDQQHRAEGSIAERGPDAQQYERNMAALRMNVETIADLIDITDAEFTAIRARTTDNWRRMISATAEGIASLGISEEAWNYLCEPWFEIRSNRIANSLCYRRAVVTEPLLPPPHEMAAQARDALRVEPQTPQSDQVARPREELSDRPGSVPPDAAIDLGTDFE